MIKKTIRNYIVASLATVVSIVGNVYAAYPERPVRLLIGFPPGGGSDIVARTLIAKLTEKWRSPVILEYKTGANGAVAASYLTTQKPDGYVLLYITSSHVLSPAVSPDKPPYDPVKSFTPVTKIQSGPLVFVARKEFPANSIGEFIALAKAKPGTVNMGASGTGTNPAIALMLLTRNAALNIVLVPYTGSGPALAAVMKGEVDAIFGTPLGVREQVEGGMVRAIAVSSKSPALATMPAFAKLPSFEEAGIKGIDIADGWSGILAPPRMSPDLLGFIHKSFVEVLNLQDVRDLFNKDGKTVWGNRPEEFASSMQQELDTWYAVFNSTGKK